MKKRTNMAALLMGLTQYFLFYNNQRPRQLLDYQTPELAYRTAMYGGVNIVDRLGNGEPTTTATNTTNEKMQEKMGQRQSAAMQLRLLLTFNKNLSGHLGPLYF